MNKNDFKKLFPLKAMVTQEIIDESDLGDYRGCVGALTLKSALDNSLLTKWDWANAQGRVMVDGKYVYITTTERVAFMDVKNPREVTFVIDTHFK